MDTAPGRQERSHQSPSARDGTHRPAGGRQIPDPYYQDNEDRVQWIGEADWIYKRTFNVPKDYLQNEQVLLCCEGLDTLATIKINATEIARTDNMFRTYEFDVKNILKPGVNIIEIQFDSTIPYIQQQQEQHPIPLRDPPHGVSGPTGYGRNNVTTAGIGGPVF